MQLTEACYELLSSEIASYSVMEIPCSASAFHKLRQQGGVPMHPQDFSNPDFGIKMYNILGTKVQNLGEIEFYFS